MQLAKQETRVARMLVAGLRQPEIAKALGVAPSTVKTHIARIRSKTGFDRHKHEQAFEVFLSELLEGRESRPPDRGETLVSLLIKYSEPSGTHLDAVLLLHAGYRDLRFHQAYAYNGQYFTEWMSDDGVIATVREHSVMLWRGKEVDLKTTLR